MKLAYIAGPFRGPTQWDIEQNVHKAEKVALKVAEFGYTVICPHTMYRHFHGQMTDQYWIDATLELLRVCNVVFVLPNWRKSAGARGEVDEAKRLGIPIEFI